MPIDLATALLIASLAILMLGNGIFALLLFDRVRASDAAEAERLGTAGTISSGWRWTRFVWSSRPAGYADRGIWRLAMAVRLSHSLCVPLFLVLVGGFLAVALEGP